MSATAIVVPVLVAYSGYKTAIKDEVKRIEKGIPEQGKSYLYSSLMLGMVILSFVPHLLGYSLIGALVESVASYTALFVAVKGLALYMEYKRLPKDASLLFTLFCAVFAAMEFIAKFYSMMKNIATPVGVEYMCLIVIVLLPFFCIGEMIAVKRSKAKK